MLTQLFGYMSRLCFPLILVGLIDHLFDGKTYFRVDILMYFQVLLQFYQCTDLILIETFYSIAIT